MFATEVPEHAANTGGRDPFAGPRAFVWMVVFNLKLQFRSRFFLATVVAQPILLACVIYLLYGAGNGGRPSSFGLVGVGLIGIWSMALFGAATLLQLQRGNRVLELHVMAPRRLLTAVSATCTAMCLASSGSYVLVLAVGRFVFDLRIAFAHPAVFAGALIVTLASVTALSVMMTGAFFFYRGGPYLANGLEYPLWLVTGLAVPLSALPFWLHVLGDALPPTWGVDALHASATGHSTGLDLPVCIGLSIAYFAMAVPLLALLERRARRDATLQLI
jgi:ABC-2 type transport system permease protein